MLIVWLVGADPHLLSLSPEERTVGQDCQTIQQCIVDSAPGDVILIPAQEDAYRPDTPGFPPSFSIEKSITLRGLGECPGKVILQGQVDIENTVNPSSPLVVTIECLTIRDTPKGDGIFIAGTVEATLTNTVISGHGRYGINVNVSANSSPMVNIRGSNIENSGQDGIFVDGLGRVGVEKSRISANGIYGVRATGSAVVTIRDSFIQDNGREVYDRELEKRVAGIAIGDKATLTLHGTTISNNQGWGVLVFRGIALTSCSDPKPGKFQGKVQGEGNTIPGKDEQDPNTQGDVCPEALKFLKTPEGGNWPQ